MDSFALRRRQTGEILQLTVDDLYGEFLQAAALPDQQFCWDLTDHSIKPLLLRQLFTRIASSGVQLSLTLAIDLDANRLEAACEDDFTVVITALQQPGLKRLVVRFGFEISVSALERALADMHMEHLLGSRVRVKTPWRNTGLLEIAEELRKMAAASDARLRAIEARKDAEQLRKTNAASDARLRAIEARKGPTDHFRQVARYNGTGSSVVEECVTAAVAAALKDGRVVSDRYEFQGRGGDIDGLVEGVYEGQPVLVLVEAKYNMDTAWRRAHSQMSQSSDYLQSLRTLMESGVSGDDDDAEVADCIALEVELHASKDIMFAFGGVQFSAATAVKLDRTQTPWFMVVSNPSGRFFAKRWVSE